MTTKLTHPDDRLGTTVYLLGAGCSASAGAPVMRHFLEAASRFHAEPEAPFAKAYEELFDYIANCRKISSVFNRDWHNIEELYTQASLAAIVDGENAVRVCEQLAWAIWDVYRRHTVEESPTAYSKFANALRGRLEMRVNGNEPRPVIITTNYDVHFEAAWTHAHHPGGRGVVTYPRSPDDSPPSSSGIFTHVVPLADVDGRRIEVIKLHGSINWFLKKNEKGEDTIVIEGDVPVGSEERFPVQSLEFARDLLSKNELRPLLIPPSLSKESVTPMIKSQWKAAVHAISHAKRIYVIGYSFPSTDVFMSRLIGEGIRNNRHLSEVRIINTSNDSDWRESVQGLFSRSFGDYRLRWYCGGFEDFAQSASYQSTRRRERADAAERIRITLADAWE